MHLTLAQLLACGMVLGSQQLGFGTNRQNPVGEYQSSAGQFLFNNRQATTVIYDAKFQQAKAFIKAVIETTKDLLVEDVGRDGVDLFLKKAPESSEYDGYSDDDSDELYSEPTPEPETDIEQQKKIKKKKKRKTKPYYLDTRQKRALANRLWA